MIPKRLRTMAKPIVETAKFNVLVIALTEEKARFMEFDIMLVGEVNRAFDTPDSLFVYPSRSQVTICFDFVSRITPPTRS